MPILGSENLTENWMTARTFAPLFRDDGLRRRFAERLLDEPLPGGADVSIELFWRGMRDYVHQCPEAGDPDDLAQRYDRLFPCLRAQVGKSGRFRPLQDHNYATSDKDGLARNVKGAEIDIVIEAPNHLLIGEAKYRSRFSPRRKDVLVHQLIRQYVTARILLDLKGCEKQIVPFVVGEDRKQLCRIGQVRFMIDHYGMRCENVLEWKDIPQPTG